MRRAAIVTASLGLLACRSGGASDELAGETGTSTSTSTSESGSTSEGSTSESDASTSDASETESDSTSEGDEWLSACPSVAAPVVAGTIEFAELAEASGLAHSRTQPIVWAHNDSGDAGRLFAVSLAGERLATLELEGVSPFDWEALAIGPGPREGEWLYVGDIGDNAQARPFVTIVRVAEPPQVAGLTGETLVISELEAFDLTYPGGPRDAEAMLVDPLTGELVIVTKGAQTELFRKPAPLAAGELESLGGANFPSAFATAADVSARGDFVALRGYGDAFGWLRAIDQSVGEAMQGEPCELPLAAELQGETLAFDALGLGYFTLSEGAAQPLWWYAYE